VTFAFAGDLGLEVFDVSLKGFGELHAWVEGGSRFHLQSKEARR
jgi:hypothetical protein